jgi:hypothetical protein
MTGDVLDLWDDERCIALERAISAAENAAQTVGCVWETLRPPSRTAGPRRRGLSHRDATWR